MQKPHDRAVLEACQDPCATSWFKAAARSALERDPVDAAHDAEELARLLSERSERILAEGLGAAGGAGQPA